VISLVRSGHIHLLQIFQQTIIMIEAVANPEKGKQSLRRELPCQVILSVSAPLPQSALSGGKGHRKDGVMDGSNRVDIKLGARVRIIQKQDQRSGRTTDGIVSNILTKSPSHPHGIKVRLTNGIIGRVKEILSET
jgi:uncharacterized repeat protein (TIGR03833 family)